MIGLRFLPREEWEAELRSYGCRPAQGLGQLNTAEFWRFPWGGYPFTVPHEEGRMLRTDFDSIIIMIASAAPPDWRFPEY